MMTHSSVVAREYGIPAVVCVDDATSRIATGQRPRVDGDGGYVLVLEPARGSPTRPARPADGWLAPPAGATLEYIPYFACIYSIQ